VRQLTVAPSADGVTVRLEITGGVVSGAMSSKESTCAVNAGAGPPLFPANGPTARTCIACVNVTGADLYDSELPGEVAASLADYDLPPEALVLEITERSVLIEPDRVGNVLARLGEMGVGLSLDDFGTGHSSLTHLKRLPIGEVKIDRSFVARMSADADDAAIVGSTIGLAHSLGMRVVAEGVEDDQTWEQLDGLGCDLIQGYMLARALPPAELEKLLPHLATGRV